MVIRMNTKGLHKKKTLGMAKNLNAENFHLVCRLCLVKTSMKLNIFHGEGIKRRLFEKILNCLSLIVSEDDKLSKVICHSCVDKLESFQDFRDMCHESENILNAFIASAGGETLKTRKEPKSSSVKISKKKHKDDDDDMEAETALVEETLKSLKEEEGEDEGSLEEDAAHDEELDLMMQDESYDDLSEEDESSGKSYEGEDSGDVEGRTIEGDNEESSEGFPYPLLQGNSQTMSRDQTLKSSVNVASSESVPACDVQINVGDVDSSTSAELGTHDQLDRRKLDGFHTVEQCGRSGASQSVNDAYETRLFVPHSSIDSEELPQRLQTLDNSNLNSLVFLPNTTNTYDYLEILPLGVRLHRSGMKLQKQKVLFECRECKKLCDRRSVLLAHFRSHTKEKPFICEICNQGFTFKSSLKQHAFLHTGIRPFACPKCGKTFTRYTHVKIHQKVHNRVRE